MATFPYYQFRPETNGRIGQFPQATETLDIVCREQVAAWLLQYERGFTDEVELYFGEVGSREITTEPVTGAEIRAYEVARNLIELAQRYPSWDIAVTNWLDIFADIAGIEPPLPEITRKLLDDTGEVLTNEAGEPLQHDLTTEDDMLFTEYMPNFAATRTDFDITEDSYEEEQVYLDLWDAPEGIYEITVSFVYSNPDANDSLYWKVSGRGGDSGITDSPEFAQESKDVSDVVPISYTYQQYIAPEDAEFQIDMRKEDSSAADINILVANIFARRIA